MHKIAVSPLAARTNTCTETCTNNRQNGWQMSVVA
jgi:hypothetical protein